MDVRLIYKDETSVIRSPYVGFSVASSLAAAVGVGLAKGEALHVICERLSLMEALPSRMSILEGKKGEIIFDDTRLATSQSTQAILKDLIALKKEAQRMILIHGPIFRLYQHGPISQETIELMKQFNKENALRRQTRQNAVAENLTALLPEIHIPTLVIWGEDDKILPLALGEQMAALIPNAQLAVIERGSHNAHEEQPQKFNAITEEFIEKL
ncbi:MAG: alpha/beta hydrolase [Ktedonobacteraceae bacterium]|nr:alpha/beta hydrolase [Ktedonobacteraceae bacterium]